MRVPEKIIDIKGKSWTYHPGIAYGEKLCYHHPGSYLGIPLSRPQVETEFTRLGRPEPTANIIRQGRWECGLASLAMLIDESLWSVKRAAASVGWNNDDRGISHSQLIKAAGLLGHDVYLTGRHDGLSVPHLIILESLNVKGFRHIVFWNGKEILDPNWGYKGRKWWGCEWDSQALKGEDTVLVTASSKCQRISGDCYILARPPLTHPLR